MNTRSKPDGNDDLSEIAMRQRPRQSSHASPSPPPPKDLPPSLPPREGQPLTTTGRAASIPSTARRELERAQTVSHGSYTMPASRNSVGSARPPVPQRSSSKASSNIPRPSAEASSSRSIHALISPRVPSPLPPKVQAAISGSSLFATDPGTPPVSQFDSVEKREERRKRIASELLETERTYLNSLTELRQEWLPAIQHALKKEKSALDELNSNLFNSVELIAQFNSTLLSDLAAVIENWTPERKVGEVFVKLAPFLKMYSQYAGHYVEAKEIFERLQKKVTSLAGVLADLSKKTGALSLDQYLIMPIQRIPRYELLLRDLLKNTANEHADHSALRSALDTVKQVADKVNSFNANESKNNERIIELDLHNALAPHRQFLCDDVFQLVDIKSSAEKRYIRLVLFSDMLIRDDAYVKGASKSINPRISKIPDHPDWCWPLKLIWLPEMNGTPTEGSTDNVKESAVSEDDDELELRGPDSSLLLIASSAAVKQRWISLIRTYITRSLDFGEDVVRRNGEFIFHHIGTYKGWWSQGYRHGQGTHIMNGTKYEGEWKTGRQDGRGIMTYVNGAVYDGEWQKGLRHGRGRYTDPVGTIYDGEWKDNRKHGKGSLTYSNGSTFNGDWERDEISGQGSLKLHSGLEYNGGWKNSKYDGLGRLKMVNGKIYEGQWRSGQREGEGKLFYPDGGLYEGNWRYNKRHGLGNYNSSITEGSWSYSGHWDRGIRHGEGTITLKDGGTYAGTWHQGKPHGKGVFHYGQTSIYMKYEGEWTSGRRHGKGELMLRGGCIIRGTFREDSPTSGRIIFSNGVVYEGSWTGDSFEGNKITVAPTEESLDAKRTRKSENKSTKTLEKVIIKSTQLTEPINGTVTAELMLDAKENSVYKSRDIYPIADLLPVLDFLAPTGQQW